MSAWLWDTSLVAVGGGFGGMLRFWVSVAASRWLGEGFPWGTLIVNASGAALIGIVAALLPGAAGGPEVGALWSALVLGALGSYTTVSSFSLQTLDLLRAGAVQPALANVLVSLVACLGAVALGHAATLALLAACLP